MLLDSHSSVSTCGTWRVWLCVRLNTAKRIRRRPLSWFGVMTQCRSKGQDAQCSPVHSSIAGSASSSERVVSRYGAHWSCLAGQGRAAAVLRFEHVAQTVHACMRREVSVVRSPGIRDEVARMGRTVRTSDSSVCGAPSFCVAGLPHQRQRLSRLATDIGVARKKMRAWFETEGVLRRSPKTNLKN